MEKSFSNWLVVSDVDGTLNNKFRKLQKDNLKAIEKFTQLGGHFTLASGRFVSSLSKHYNRVPANAPGIIINGAAIYDYKAQKTVWRQEITQAGKELVLKLMEQFPKLDVGIFFDDYLYIVRDGIKVRFQIHFDKVQSEVTPIDQVPEHGWCKVVFWEYPWNLKKFIRYVDDNLRDNPDVNFMQTSPWSFEMVEGGVHKGASIMKLAEQLGIEKSHVAAIGDYYNDYDMLRTVGLPACAGQAPQPIKDLCKYHAVHCNKGCVADFLNYIMSLEE